MGHSSRKDRSLINSPWGLRPSDVPPVQPSHTRTVAKWQVADDEESVHIIISRSLRMIDEMALQIAQGYHNRWRTKKEDSMLVFSLRTLSLDKSEFSKCFSQNEVAEYWDYTEPTHRAGVIARGARGWQAPNRQSVCGTISPNELLSHKIKSGVPSEEFLSDLEALGKTTEGQRVLRQICEDYERDWLLGTKPGIIH